MYSFIKKNNALKEIVQFKLSNSSIFVSLPLEEFKKGIFVLYQNLTI